MSQRTPTRIAATLLLTLCLAGGAGAGVGVSADQGLGKIQPRHHSASASATRVQQARSGLAPGQLDSALTPGSLASLSALVATGRIQAPGTPVSRSAPVERRSGRSPPEFQ